MILIDSNVLIDVMDGDVRWGSWSSQKPADATSVGLAFVNTIVVAEVAPRTGSLAAFYSELAKIDVAVEPLTDAAAFAAGTAFQNYRRRRPQEKMVLPDFMIGGHAGVLGATILTRDPRLYESYFPSVLLITPGSAA